MPQPVSSWLAWLLGGDHPVEPLQLHQIALRAVAVYVAGLLIVRIGKSRLLGRVTALDVLMGFILGSVLGRGITGGASLSGTVVASLTLVALHWLFTWFAFQSTRFGALFKGHAVVLVRDGVPDHHALAASHISMNDLEGELRLQGVERVEDVRLAVKERNGEVSVIPRRTPT